MKTNMKRHLVNETLVAGGIVQILRSLIKVDGIKIPRLAQYFLLAEIFQTDTYKLLKNFKGTYPMFGLAKSLHGILKQLLGARVKPEDLTIINHFNSNVLLQKVFEKYQGYKSTQGWLDEEDILVQLTEKIMRLGQDEKNNLRYELEARLGTELSIKEWLVIEFPSSTIEQEFLKVLSSELRVNLPYENSLLAKDSLNLQGRKVRAFPDINQEIEWCFNEIVDSSESGPTLVLVPNLGAYRESLKQQLLKFGLSASWDYPLTLAATPLVEAFLEYVARDGKYNSPFIKQTLRKSKYPKILPETGIYGEFIDILLKEFAPRLVIPGSRHQTEEDYCINVKAYNKLIQVLNEIKFTLETLQVLDKQMTQKEFLFEFASFLEETEIRITFQGADLVIGEFKDVTNNHTINDIEFKKLYLLGLAEGLWPAKRANHWLMSDEIKQELARMGFVLSEETVQDRKTTHRLNSLLEDRNKVMNFSYPKAGLNKSLLISSFLEEFSIEEITMERTKEEPHVNLASLNMALTNYKKFSYRVTELNTYAKCPRQYLYKYCWQLPTPLSEAQAERIALGDICHRVLEKLWLEPGNMVKHSNKQKNIGEVIDIVVAEQQNEKKSLCAHKWVVIRDKSIKYITAWLNAQNLQREDQIVNRYIEIAFGLEDSVYPELALKRDGETILIQGKIDRVDIDKSGQAYIYDYKLGSLPSNDDISRSKELQVPVYMIAFDQLMKNPGEKLGDGVYSSIKYRKNISIRTNKEVDCLEKILNQAVDKVFEITRHIEEGHFPRLERPSECFNLCGYRKLCWGDVN
ncbi:MAG: PD-(D/E)XK nuclease family protein [Desulfitobacterium hafniense]|nr:PD-(D/E)XK nuclease family protein [Desulfitobacterium hafniense]